MSDRPSISERYARAVDATDLTVSEAPSAADMIIAAGLASQGDQNRSIALALWRMKQGDLSSFAACCGVLGAWLKHKADKERFKDGGKYCYERVVSRTVYWWLDPHCRHCDGRGHPLIPNTPVLDETRNCPRCDGTGITPLEGMVRQEYVYAAKTLANEMDRITAEVFAQMRRLTRSSGQ